MSSTRGFAPERPGRISPTQDTPVQPLETWRAEDVVVHRRALNLLHLDVANTKRMSYVEFSAYSRTFGRPKPRHVQRRANRQHKSETGLIQASGKRKSSTRSNNTSLKEDWTRVQRMKRHRNSKTKTKLHHRTNSAMPLRMMEVRNTRKGRFPTRGT